MKYVSWSKTHNQGGHEILPPSQPARSDNSALPGSQQCSNCSTAQKSFFKDEVPIVIPSSLPNQSEPPQQPQVFNSASLAKFSRRSTALEAESRMPFLQGLCEDVQSEYASHKSSGMMFL